MTHHGHQPAPRLRAGSKHEPVLPRVGRVMHAHRLPPPLNELEQFVDTDSSTSLGKFAYPIVWRVGPVNMRTDTPNRDAFQTIGIRPPANPALARLFPAWWRAAHSQAVARTARSRKSMIRIAIAPPELATDQTFASVRMSANVRACHNTGKTERSGTLLGRKPRRRVRPRPGPVEEQHGTGPHRGASAYDRFNALSTARTEASSMLVSTPAPHRVRPSACLI